MDCYKILRVPAEMETNPARCPGSLAHGKAISLRIVSTAHVQHLLRLHITFPRLGEAHPGLTGRSWFAAC